MKDFAWSWVITFIIILLHVHVLYMLHSFTLFLYLLFLHPLFLSSLPPFFSSLPLHYPPSLTVSELRLGSSGPTVRAEKLYFLSDSSVNCLTFTTSSQTYNQCRRQSWTSASITSKSASLRPMRAPISALSFYKNNTHTHNIHVHVHTRIFPFNYTRHDILGPLIHKIHSCVHV